jgi:hypothetical protein
MMSTSTELTRSREHLSENRRMIIARSLATGIAGGLPIPIVEEWLSATIERGMIKKIAERNQVDLDDAAIRAIADGPSRPPEWTEVVGGGVAWRLIGRMWRRVLIVLLAARRAQAASKAFTVATLFDHYCARLHRGLGLDAVDGAQVRALIEQAIDKTEGGLARTLFRRGLLAAARASVKAPLRAANALTGGAIKKLLGSGDEGVAIAEVESELERQIDDEDGFLSRAVTAVELQLAAESVPYLDELIDNFEALVRDQRRDE